MIWESKRWLAAGVSASFSSPLTQGSVTTIPVLLAIPTIPPTRPARVSTWKIPSQVERRHQDSRRVCQEENPRPRFRHRQAIGESDENELVVVRAEAAPLSAGTVVVVDDQQGSLHQR